MSTLISASDITREPRSLSLFESLTTETQISDLTQTKPMRGNIIRARFKVFFSRLFYVALYLFLHVLFVE